METSARTETAGRRSPTFGQMLRVLVAMVLTVPVVGASYEFVQQRLDTFRYPMPGRLVEIGGTALHIHCAGSGSPTVIFDAGLGDSSATWDLVLPEVSKFTRSCAYDRAGYGWSEPPNEPRTTANIASELDHLLSNAGIVGPYVLVGHSFGGFNIRIFQAMHPEQIVGMVFVDSSHPEQIRRLPSSARVDDYISHYLQGVWLMPFGVPRILGWCRQDYSFPNAPAAWNSIAPKAIALDCRRAAWNTEVAEMRLFAANSEAIQRLGTVGKLPIVVLSHDPAMGGGFPPADAAAAERTWAELQEELRALSTNSKRIVARGSGHYIEVYRPELVIQAIREITLESKGLPGFEPSTQAVGR